MPIKILVVDDEPDFQMLIKAKFSNRITHRELEFVFATSGLEALEKLKNDETLGIILIDINMPGMNGLELLAELPKLDRLYRALIVTAYGDMSNIRKAMNFGASDFITKPIKFPDFEAAIDNAIKQYTQEKESQELLQKSALKVKGFKQDLKAIHEPIAIVGIGCRFPGGANDLDSFWSLMAERFDAVSEIPKERMDIEPYYDPNPRVPGKMYVRQGAFLNVPVDQFDAEFFGISPKEAEAMDPQQRLILEVIWEALENAGINPELLSGSQSSAFIALCMHDYDDLLTKFAPPEKVNFYFSTGNESSIISARVSYILDLKGPSLTLDTACSSSLVALHEACKSLHLGESSLAIAGGVNIMLSPDVFIKFCNGGMLAPDGHCKTFDAKADGYVRGEGCGIAILKRLSDAQKDGDRILAVIRSTAVNQDGASSGLTVPNGEAQASLIRGALKDADLNPNSIDYVEMHGTGTSLGDPIEVKALTSIFAGRKEKPLLLGSIKTNMGHLEAAAGMAGVLKVVLSLQHEALPPLRNFQTLNPGIDLEAIPAKIPLQLTPWPKSTAPRIAGVSSFGYGGTNAHIIIEEAPKTEDRTNAQDRPLHILTLSAKTQKALDELIEIYKNKLPEGSLADIAYTANTGRAHFPYRAAVIAETKEELLQHLNKGEYLIDQIPKKIPEVVFHNKGEKLEPSELMKTSPVFKEAIERHSGQFENAFFDFLKSWGIIGERSADKEKIPEGAFVISPQNTWKGLLEILSHLYLKGCHIDWKAFDKPYSRKKISLPTYPFQRKRYWIDEIKLKGKRSLTKEVHPLLGELIICPLEEKLFRNELDLEFLPYLADHKIFDYILFPGAGFAELFHAAGNTLFQGRSFAISNLVIEQPLVLYAKKETLLELLARPKEGGYKASIYSIEGESWVTHATSELSVLETIPTLNLEWEHLCGVCKKSIEIDDLYKHYDAIGLHYGKQFQTLRNIKIGDNECIAELEGEASPALLDGCLQALCSLIQQESEQNIYLPISIDRLICLAELGSSIRIHGKLIQVKNNTLSADLSIFAYDGTPLMKIEGFHARKTNKEHLQQMLAKQTKLETSSWFYQTAWQPKPLEKTEGELKGPWLIISEEKEGIEGLEAKIIKPQQAIEEIKENPYQGILWFVSGKDSLKHILSFVQTVETIPRLYFITRGIQSVGPITDLECAPFNGFYKTLKLEMPSLECRHIDLGLNEKLSLKELIASDEEDQVAFHEGIRYVPRLLHAENVKRSGKKILIPRGQSFQLETSAKGSLENLYMKPKNALSSPSANEIIIEVKAAGLNFRDVLNALGLYPGDPGPLGGECAGIVRAVGKEITNFKEGDSVVGFASGCFASEIAVPADLFTLMPLNLSFKEAAAIPIVFSTAYYALIKLAKLKAGEKVLIHAAAGGVGLAAIQVAQQVGAEIYATASSSEKHTYLKSLGISHIYNSRTLDYADEILRDTQGQGVDVVLNSLTGEGFIAKTLTACHQGARFIEIGKRDIWSKEEMNKVRPDIDYFILAIDDLIIHQPQEVGNVLHTLITQFENNTFKPLHSITFDITDTEKAFEYLQRAKNIGKVVLTIPEDQKFKIDPDGSYLITGGFGGLGMEVAKWLAKEGAKHLVLVGRNISHQIEIPNVTIEKISLDISQKTAVEALMKKFGKEWPELKGIIHAAGVIDDAVISSQDWGKFEKVFAPKVQGSWNLHEASLNKALDFFVLFSSVASTLGSAGQINYASANAYLDALAYLRQDKKLPALSISWGPWAEVGLAAKLTERHLASGFIAFKPEEGIKAFELALKETQSHVTVMGVDWKMYGIKNAFLSNLTGHKTIEKSTVLQRLTDALPLEREDILIEHLQRTIGKIMGIANLDPDRGFFEAGMDSLMAVELRNKLQSDLGAKYPLPTSCVFDYSTINKLDKFILNIIFPTKPVTEKKEDLVETNQRSLSLQKEISEMSQEDLNKWLE